MQSTYWTIIPTLRIDFQERNLTHSFEIIELKLFSACQLYALNTISMTQYRLSKQIGLLEPVENPAPRTHCGSLANI